MEHIAPHSDTSVTDAAIPDSLASLRRRVLDAGQRIVERDRGLRLSLETITLDDAAKEAGLSRSSLYRVWSTKEAFQVDLLCDLAGPGWQGYSAFDQQTVLEARTVLAEHIDLLATPGGRRSVMLEAVRRAAWQNFVAISTSTRWLTYIALTATNAGLPEQAARRIRRSLREAEQVFNSRMSDFYEDMATALGYKLRQDRESFGEMAAVGAAVIEGLALRHVMSPDLVDRTVLVPNGEFTAEWSLPAVGFLAIAEAFLEPDETYDGSTALSVYLKTLAEREAATRIMPTTEQADRSMSPSRGDNMVHPSSA